MGKAVLFGMSVILLCIFSAAQTHALFQSKSDYYQSMAVLRISRYSTVTLSSQLTVSHITSANENPVFNNVEVREYGGLGFSFSRTVAAMRPNGPVIRRGPLLKWSVALPCWFLIAISAPVPLKVLIGVYESRKHSRQTSSLCTVCGYNVSHSPSRCPECGTQIPELNKADKGSRLI